MTPTEIVYSFFLGAIVFFLLQGASNWALEKHHNRAKAKHQAQIWERAAQADTKEIQLTIKKETQE